MTESFSALARYYERHFRTADELPPKLYVTRLESGSVTAEIAPYAMLLGSAIYTLDASIIVSDFSKRLRNGITAFSNPPTAGAPSSGSPPLPSREDAEDMKAFIRPLTGKRGASLSIRHARIEKTDGARSTVVEYAFDEAEINRAAINIDNQLGGDMVDDVAPPDARQDTGIKTEVMLFFEQANRRPGKERGRTGDKGIIPNVCDKALPVYFRKSFQILKEQMIQGDLNPLTDTAFIVDVHVQQVNGEPRAYIVTAVHDVMQIGDES